MKFDSRKELGLPLRILAYGVPKTKKTWWAASAAESGFRVILLDCDNGYHIISQLSEKARALIEVVDIVDKRDTEVAAMFLTYFFKLQPFNWDEEAKSVANIPSVAVKTHRHIRFDQTQLRATDVVIVDSWTAFCQSLVATYAREKKIDISLVPKKKETNWDGYQWAGMMADWALDQIKKIPCSIIVVAHGYVYEKRNAEEGEQKGQVEWSRTVVKSTSGNQSLRLPAYFSDILWFKLVHSSFHIDTSAAEDRDGGSRLVSPGLYQWDKLPFSTFAKAAGLDPSLADPTLTPIKSFAPGEINDWIDPAKQKAVAATVVKATAPAAQVGNGISKDATKQPIAAVSTGTATVSKLAQPGGATKPVGSSNSLGLTFSSLKKG